MKATRTRVEKLVEKVAGRHSLLTWEEAGVLVRLEQRYQRARVGKKVKQLRARYLLTKLHFHGVHVNRLAYIKALDDLLAALRGGR